MLNMCFPDSGWITHFPKCPLDSNIHPPLTPLISLLALVFQLMAAVSSLALTAFPANSSIESGHSIISADQVILVIFWYSAHKNYSVSLHVKRPCQMSMLRPNCCSLKPPQSWFVCRIVGTQDFCIEPKFHSMWMWYEKNLGTVYTLYLSYFSSDWLLHDYSLGEKDQV